MRSRSHGPALAAEYLDALKHQRRLAAATLGNYSHAIDLLLKLHGEQELKTLEPAQVRRYVAMLHAKGLAPRSLALTLSAWRGWFRWLARHKGWRCEPGARHPRAEGGAAAAQGAVRRGGAATAGFAEEKGTSRRFATPRCSSCCTRPACASASWWR